MSEPDAEVRRDEDRQRMEHTLRQHAALTRMIRHSALVEGRIDDALPLIAEKAADILDVEWVGIWRLSPDGKSLVCLEDFRRSGREHSSGRVLQVEKCPRYFASLEAGLVVDTVDARKDPRTSELTAEYWKPMDVRSVIETPVYLYGRVVGVVRYGCVGAPRVWFPYEVAFGVRISDMVAQTLLHAETSRRLEEVALFSRVISLSASAGSLDDALEDMCAELARFFGVPRAAFAVLDPQGAAAEVIVEHLEPGHPSSVGVVIPVKDNPSMELMSEHKTPLAITDAPSELLPPAMHSIIRELGIKSILLVPVVIDDRLMGTLGLDSPERREFTEREIAIAQNVANQVGQVLGRKKAEEEARMLGRAVEQAIDGIAVADLEGKVLFANTAWAQMHGYLTDELPGRHLSIFHTPEQLREEVVPFNDEVLRTGSNQGEVGHMRKDGTIFPTLMTVTLLKDERGKSIGLVGMAVDITEQKRVEEELRRAKEIAEAATLAKSGFLANMSHEIRTPLNAIIGMTGLLLDADLLPEQREYVETIRTSSDSLLSVINDILDFSKIEAGKMELEKYGFDLRHCIDTSFDLVSPIASQKGLKLSYSVSDSTPNYLVGDVNRLRQVLVNLLGNAVKFTEVGEVSLSVVSCMFEDDVYRLHFAVRDTGIGIPRERMDRLFKSFSQVDASTTRKYGGTGLGLTISEKLVEMMGGRIWVESEEGRGSTFHFTVMVELYREEEEASPDTMPLSGRRALVVDGDRRRLNALAVRLRSWEMSVEAVSSAEESMRLIRRGDRFDVVLLEERMPGTGGLALAAEIRRHRSPEELPIVILTSNDGGLPETEGEDAHLAAYLTRPVKPQELYGVLVNTLTGRSASTREIPPQLHLDSDMGLRHPLHILVAEDNPVNQKVVFRILERLGYRADVVANGLEALEALERRSYDVVLMDVQMPEMDGVEATRRIRERYAGGKRPHIIAMTAHALSGAREEYLDEGMDDYVGKPVRIEELVEVLERSTTGPAPDGGVEGVPDGPVDSRVLDEFLGGMDGYGVGLIELFIGDAAGLVASMREAAARREADALRRAAHSLKSSSATLGAFGLSALCLDLEGMEGDEVTPEMEEKVARVCDEYARVKAALEERASN